MDVTHTQEAGPGPADDAATDAEGPIETESIESTLEQAGDFFGDVGALVSAHPIAMLLTTLGVGYVAGGGIFTKMTRRLLGNAFRLGMQLAVLPTLERGVAELMGGTDAAASPLQGDSES